MHHAYLIEGPLSLLPGLEASARTLFDFEDSKEGANPDVHIYSFEKLNIEEARGLSDEAAFKALSGRTLFVIAAGSISFDAQQALLKLFEEPQPGTTFVVLVPPGALMPTLRSRFAEYPEKLKEDDVSSTPAKKFLASPTKDRSTQIAALLKDEEGVKERVREFLNSLEALLYKKIADPKAREGLEDISLVRGYLADRSASLKMLLEHLAATLPTA